MIDLESFYPVEGSLRAGDAAQPAAGGAGIRRLARKASRSTSIACSTAENGKPRVSVISIAHLDDQERMFFVSLLLNEIVGWMRSQRGTSSLRALVYFDEIFGFLPPVANPPSKAPLLTLLKQARAFGVGLVVATQNPVDLDYKALSNAGTWMLGRLQTERDKARVLDGLEGAPPAGRRFDRAHDRSPAVGARQAHLPAAQRAREGTGVFETRWTISYLRGPLGRDEIKRLTRFHRFQAVPERSSAHNSGSTVRFPGCHGFGRARARSGDSAVVCAGRDDLRPMLLGWRASSTRTRSSVSTRRAMSRS